MNQMLELFDKDYKAAIIKILLKAIKNSLETKKIEISAKKCVKNKVEMIELKDK